MIKTYYKIILFTAITVTLFCFVLPFLVSAESTELVLMGIATIFIVYIPATIAILKPVISKTRKEKE